MVETRERTERKKTDRRRPIGATIMSKNTNRKSERVTERPFKVPNLRPYEPKSVQPKIGTQIKICGKNAAEIDDIVGTIHNSYTVTRTSRLFFNIKQQQFFIYLTIAPFSGAAQ